MYVIIPQVLDDRTDILQNHITARPLGQAVGHLLADDDPVLFRDGFDLRIGDPDDFDRHILAEAKARVSYRIAALLDCLLARIADRLGWCHFGGFARRLEQRLLVHCLIDQTLLGLRSEQLALEPGELLLERGKLVVMLSLERCMVSLQCVIIALQPSVLLRADRGFRASLWHGLHYTSAVWHLPVKALELTRFFDLDAIEQQPQIGPTQRLLVTAMHVVVELPLLQALAPQAIAASVEVEHLHVGPPAVDEHEQVAAHGILFELVARQGRQTIELFAHVGGPSIQPDPDAIFREKHQRRRSRRQRPPPRSSSMSQPGSEPVMAPRSIHGDVADSGSSQVAAGLLPARRRFQLAKVLSASLSCLQNATWLRPLPACSSIRFCHCFAERRMR